MKTTLGIDDNDNHNNNDNETENMNENEVNKCNGCCDIYNYHGTLKLQGCFKHQRGFAKWILCSFMTVFVFLFFGFCRQN